MLLGFTHVVDDERVLFLRALELFQIFILLLDEGKLDFRKVVAIHMLLKLLGESCLHFNSELVPFAEFGGEIYWYVAVFYA